MLPCLFFFFFFFFFSCSRRKSRRFFVVARVFLFLLLFQNLVGVEKHVFFLLLARGRIAFAKAAARSPAGRRRTHKTRERDFAPRTKRVVLFLRRALRRRKERERERKSLASGCLKIRVLFFPLFFCWGRRTYF